MPRGEDGLSEQDERIVCAVRVSRVNVSCVQSVCSQSFCSLHAVRPCSLHAVRPAPPLQQSRTVSAIPKVSHQLCAGLT
eukprot:3824294-Rhodomonas_salina.1